MALTALLLSHGTGSDIYQFVILIASILLFIYIAGIDLEEVDASKLLIRFGVFTGYYYVVFETWGSIYMEIVQLGILVIFGLSVASLLDLGSAAMSSNGDDNQATSASNYKDSAVGGGDDDEQKQSQDLPPTGHIVESESVDEGAGPTVTNVSEENEK
jgi:hypothetical protein